MLGFRFSEYDPDQEGQSIFDRLLDIFQELLLYTSGDVAEALDWLTQLDQQYQLTADDYGIADFIDELIRKGYLEENPNNKGEIKPSAKMEKTIRREALEEIFGKLKRGTQGQHQTRYTGIGDEPTEDKRPFQFGDSLDQIAMTESLRNAQINHGLGEFRLTENDLEVQETTYKTSTSTVLMIDISHSMILYGEDRITPAKKTAMALAELIRIKYPKDKLDVIVFGNDAWQIQIKDIPYLQVGPYHTNTVAGLELAMDLLRRRKGSNQQIFMITDGKPTCIKKGKKYYKNSFGLDRKILNRTLTLAKQCRKLNIPITTFMIASDPYLKRFVHQFTQANNGRAFYSSLKGLGEFIFEDYERGKRKRF